MASAEGRLGPLRGTFRDILAFIFLGAFVVAMGTALGQPHTVRLGEGITVLGVYLWMLGRMRLPRQTRLVSQLVGVLVFFAIIL